MKKHYLGLIALLGITLAVACKKDKDDEAPYDEVKQAAIDEQTIKDYIAANNITGMQRDSTGVYWKVLQNGINEDTIALDDRFNISYKGWLLNGTRFDSANNTTFNDIRLGSTGLIAGFKVGPQKTSKKGVVQYLIPSVLGYRNRQQGSIPPNSVLKFEVTVNDFYY